MAGKAMVHAPSDQFSCAVKWIEDRRQIIVSNKMSTRNCLKIITQNLFFLNHMTVKSMVHPPWNQCYMRRHIKVICAVKSFFRTRRQHTVSSKIQNLFLLNHMPVKSMVHAPSNELRMRRQITFPDTPTTRRFLKNTKSFFYWIIWLSNQCYIRRQINSQCAVKWIENAPSNFIFWTRRQHTVD